MAKKAPGLVDERLIKALGHPIRMRALTILNQRVASPLELSRELDQPLVNVSYHVKTLEKLGCIELVRTEQRRGALEHYYRAVMRPWFGKRDWSRLPVSGRQSVSATVVDQIFSDVVDAMQAGTFDQRPDRHLSRTPTVVDQEGWRKIAALLDQTLEQVLEIQAEAAGRLKDQDDPDAGIAMQVDLMHFEMPTQAGAAREKDGRKAAKPKSAKAKSGR